METLKDIMQNPADESVTQSSICFWKRMCFLHRTEPIAPLSFPCGALLICMPQPNRKARDPDALQLRQMQGLQPEVGAPNLWADRGAEGAGERDM